MHEKLYDLFKQHDKKNDEFCKENYFMSKRPFTLNQAKVKSLNKSIEGHIIVCGLVKGIRNLILPLRQERLGNRLPIVILNDGGDEVGEAAIWQDIKFFEDIYLIKGSAMNPADLEKANAPKAKSIIILAKDIDNT